MKNSASFRFVVSATAQIPRKLLIAINKTQRQCFLFLSLVAGTIFLSFTLNAFCIFFMLVVKSFTIFQLIEKLHLVLLSAFAVFSLCASTESTNKAITDCATVLNTMYSHDAFENINHKVEVCFNESETIFFIVHTSFHCLLFPCQIEIIFTKIIIQRQSFVFTCGYFEINMRMLHSFVYTSITYLVILLQFNFE